jgi:hypothetical protein
MVQTRTVPPERFLIPIGIRGGGGTGKEINRMSFSVSASSLSGERSFSTCPLLFSAKVSDYFYYMQSFRKSQAFQHDSALFMIVYKSQRQIPAAFRAVCSAERAGKLFFCLLRKCDCPLFPHFLRIDDSFSLFSETDGMIRP